MNYPHNTFFPSSALYAPDQDRKRQRRLTAGAFASIMFGSRPPPQGRRPVVLIPPRGIGPVRRINKNDVLAGRGGRINSHVGNIQFREIVLQRKEDYRAHSTRKLEKAHIAAEIVYLIRSLDPPGRFLKEDPDGAWYDIGDEKAIKKVGQALREDALAAKQKDADEACLVNKECDWKENTGDESMKMDKLAIKSASNEAASKAASPPHVQSRSIVTVSSRGAKRISMSTRSIEAAQAASSLPFQPLTYDEASDTKFSFAVPAPVNKVENSSTSNSSFGSTIRGMFRRNKLSKSQVRGVSGAAAAAMNEAAEEAFGLPFHPAENASQPAEMHQAETSLVSGMSSLSDWSHPSNSLVATPASFAAPGQSHRQRHHTSHFSTMPLHQLQCQWRDANVSCYSPSHDCPGVDPEPFNVPGSPERAQEVSLMNYSPENSPYMDTRGRNMRRSHGKRSRSYGSGRSSAWASGLCDGNSSATENDSINSIPGSILSDLSESLMALDLADVRAKDIFESNQYL